MNIRKVIFHATVAYDASSSSDSDDSSNASFCPETAAKGRVLAKQQDCKDSMGLLRHIARNDVPAALLALDYDMLEEPVVVNDGKTSLETMSF